MKQIVLFSTLFALVISLAAPMGAAFALEGAVLDEPLIEKTDESEQPQKEPLTPLPLSTTEGDIDSSVDQVAEASATDQTVPPPEPIIIDPVENDPVMPAPASVANTIVITEIQTRGVSSASVELVELYNASATAIDVTGWCLQYAAAGVDSGYRNSLCITSGDGVVSTRVLLPARSYMVFISSAASVAMPTFVHDGLLGVAMADSGGRLRLVGSSSEVIDQVGWGGGI